MRVARVARVYVPGAEAASDSTEGIQGLQIVYSDRRFRDLFDEGLRVSAEARHAFSLDHRGQPYNDSIFDLNWGFPAPLRGSIDALAHAFVGSVPIVFEERLGGLDGSRTVPGSGLVGADRYASFALAYQVLVVVARRLSDRAQKMALAEYDPRQDQLRPWQVVDGHA